jgi:hypothetical protein
MVLLIDALVGEYQSALSAEVLLGSAWIVCYVPVVIYVLLHVT